MNAVQNKMTIQKLYIYNGDGKYFPCDTIQDLKCNLNNITQNGYNAIGVDYSIRGLGEFSLDIYVRDSEDKKFKISNDILSPNIHFDLSGFEYCDELKELQDLIPLI